MGMRLFMLGLLVTSVALPALAQTQSPGIDRREQRQQQRIQQGIQSGQMTPKEATRLEHEQARIREEESAMKADGKLDATERRKLQQDLNRSSRHIAKEKHDRQKDR
ncbi:MAG: hypothetical protein EPO61_03980 [Nitrospirae bacterium]|nr:MAG: hypothetical protein EPO61_03980 [Nitrospirota bacterium]